MFSFFYTEKIANYVLENNELYKAIDAEKDTYEVLSVNASINGNYIVPGLNGEVVNVKDSYYNMKDIEVFNAYYLKYDITYPEVSLYSNIDKIINIYKKEQLIEKKNGIIKKLEDKTMEQDEIKQLEKELTEVIIKLSKLR